MADSKDRQTRGILSYGQQSLDDEDMAAVAEVLNGDWLTQGPAVERFERALCEYFGTRHAVVCSSGTAALHLVALCMDWKSGDVVIVPGNTFVATANCCRYVGAEPYFVDIDDATLTIDPNEVERQIKRLLATGKKVRAIIGVDIAGHGCDWIALHELADRYSLRLIDDACHAMGGSYQDTKIGSCTHCDVTTLSFHPVKNFTSGEGGAILTNDGQFAERARRLRSHGIVRVVDRRDSDGPWQYDMTELGYNYRLTDFQCALGSSQLKKLDSFVRRRRELAALYDHLFAQLADLRCPVQLPTFFHAYHLYILRIAFDSDHMSRKDFFAQCLERGVRLQVHYRPVVQNSYYAGRPVNIDALERLPVSIAAYRESISLPIYPHLEDSDVSSVAQTIIDLRTHVSRRADSPSNTPTSL